MTAATQLDIQPDPSPSQVAPVQPVHRPAVAEPRVTTPPVAHSPRWPWIIAAVGALVVAAALVAWTTHRISSNASAAVLLGGCILVLYGIYCAVAYGPASPSGTSTLARRVSISGLILSAIAVLAAIPHITTTAGVGTFATDLAAQLWTLAILSALAAPVRTLPWTALLGAAFTGFLAITSLARLVARPLVLSLGTSSVLATAIWVPLTEELVKTIPLVFIIRLALRRTTPRPSALDLMLVGAWTGAGFALYEDAVLGRGSFHLTAAPLLSFVFPSVLENHALGWTVVQTGHLVHSALIGVGVGFALLYRSRLRQAGIVGIVAITAVLLEHMGQNAIATGHIDTAIGRILLALTLNGRLTCLLLLAGTAAVLALEWRAVGVVLRREQWTTLSPPEARRRALLLARAQSSPTSHTTRATSSLPAGAA